MCRLGRLEQLCADFEVLNEEEKDKILAMAGVLKVSVRAEDEVKVELLPIPAKDVDEFRA